MSGSNGFTRSLSRESNSDHGLLKKVSKEAKIRNQYNQVPHPTKVSNLFLMWGMVLNGS